MRLYLSSYRMGAHPDRLLRLCTGRRAGLIPNALDGLPDAVRKVSIRRDAADLEHLGLQVIDIDLRDPDAAGRLAAVDLVWVRGGNTFALRRALADTATDQVLTELIESDAITYGGYSAGACVLAPDLSGLEQVDDVAAVADPITTGLGMIDRPLVPHVSSPGHPEADACDALAAWYQSQGQPHWALRDGEVLIVNGNVTELLGIDQPTG